jgi:hypothetical protein
MIEALQEITPDTWLLLGTALLAIASEILPFIAKVSGNGVLHALATALQNRKK